MNISNLIDQYVEIKRQRSDLAAQDKALGQQLQALEGDIMHQMREAGTFRAASEHGHTVNMSKSTVPTVVDWDEFYKFVTETKSFDLLQKRLSAPAFRDRWEAGQPIDGTATSEIWGLRITTSRS